MSKKRFSEKPVSSKILYSGKLIKVREDFVKSERGSFSREIVEHSGSATIVPIIGNSIIMVRQFRQTTKKVLLELPAGTLKSGENPEKCAERELVEETGYKAGCLKKMFQCYVAPGYNTEVSYIYLATDLAKAEQRLEEDENIEVVKIEFERVLQMIERNEIEDAKSIIGILFFQNFLNTK